MKNIYILTFVVILVSIFGLPAGSLEAQSDLTGKELMEKAKLELFDRKWDAASDTLDRLITRFPDSTHYPLALFYKGKCLMEQKKTERALDVYNRYIAVSKNRSLREDAYIAVIETNFLLYKSGKKQYAENIIDLLKNSEEAVRYFAAIKLSYVKDKKIAKAAVPLLKRIAREESDDELVDRAKVALMRIDPGYLKDVSKEKDVETRMFNIRVIDKKTKKVSFSLSIPFVLAKLAMDALPAEGKEAMEEEGLDIEKILNTLVKIPKLIRFEEKDVIVEVWLE